MREGAVLAMRGLAQDRDHGAGTQTGTAGGRSHTVRPADPVRLLHRSIGNAATAELLRQATATATQADQETVPGPGETVFRVADSRAFLRSGPPAFEPTGETIPRGSEVIVLRYDKTRKYAEVRTAGKAADGDPQILGWTAVSNLVERHETSGYVTKGTLSDVSFGETRGLYPADRVEYDPALWDAGRVRELLAARAAVHAVGGRGESVKRGTPPKDNPLEQLLATYHLVENFPPVDAVIADPAVKWLYLAKDPELKKHKGLIQPHVRVKSYGPFYNAGGGDVPRGSGVYVHFFKLA